MTDKPTLPAPKRGQVWTREDCSLEVLADEPVALGDGEVWPVLITIPSGYRYVGGAALLDGNYTPRPSLSPLSEWWVNVYPDGDRVPLVSAERADRHAFEDRIARVPLVPDLSRVVWCRGREVSS